MSLTKAVNRKGDKTFHVERRIVGFRRFITKFHLLRYSNTKSRHHLSKGCLIYKLKISLMRNFSSTSKTVALIEKSGIILPLYSETFKCKWQMWNLYTWQISHQKRIFHAVRKIIKYVCNFWLFWECFFLFEMRI